MVSRRCGPRSTSSATRRRPRMTRRRSPPPRPRSCWCRRTSTAARRAAPRRRLQLLYELADRTDCVSDDDPRQRDRRDPPGPEPRRPRGGHAPERLRHRHEPRLVRPDAAGDRREARAPTVSCRRCSTSTCTRWVRTRTSSRRTPTPCTTRSPTSRTTGSTASTAPAMAAEFDRQHIRYFNYEPYDFFGTFYGDTVPTVAFHAAGMTFEKQSGDPLPHPDVRAVRDLDRVVFAAASDNGRDPRGLARLVGRGVPGGSRRPARAERGLPEGPRAARAGRRPARSSATTSCATTRRKAYERAAAWSRRLQRMDVERLPADRAAHACRTSAPTATRRASTALPAGTYWIPMAQAQKHWVQSMLNEDTYIPYDVTYDVTGVEQPAADEPARAGSRAPTRRRGGVVGRAVGRPSVAVRPVGRAVDRRCSRSRQHGRLESAGRPVALRRRSGTCPYDDVTAADITAGALADIDVLVVPDGYANYGLQALGAKGKKALVAWVERRRAVRRLGGRAPRSRRGSAPPPPCCRSRTRTCPAPWCAIALDETGPLADGRRPVRVGDVRGRPDDGSGPGASGRGLPGRLERGLRRVRPRRRRRAAGRDVGHRRRARRRRAGSSLFSFDPVFRGWTDGTAADPLERDRRDRIRSPGPPRGPDRRRVRTRSGPPARRPCACRRWRRPSGSRSRRVTPGRRRGSSRRWGPPGSGRTRPAVCCS